MYFTNFLESSFRYWTIPSVKNMISFVRSTHSLLNDVKIAKLEGKVVDAHLRAALETAETIQYEKNNMLLRSVSWAI